MAIAEADVTGQVVARGRGMHVLGFVSGLRSGARALPGASAKAPKTSEAGDAEEDGVDGPTRWKRNRAVFERGNYDRYYGYRYANAEAEDLRLAALRGHFGHDLFEGQEVLDIGCNSGRVSLAVRSLGACRVVGTDVDKSLIEAAQTSACSAGPGASEVEFRAEDILESPLRRPPSTRPERFDVVLCFSVTKWVHFAHGDVGVRSLFKCVLKRLRPGGLFVLEPQDWKSYVKRKKLSPEIRETVRGIELRPEAFGDCLAQLGFEKLGALEPPAGSLGGFKRRPILLFGRPLAEADAQQDASAYPWRREASQSESAGERKRRRGGDRGDS